MISKHELGILAGCKLGDGYFPKRGANVYIAHTNKQRDYVLSKGRLFESLGYPTRYRMDYTMNTTLGQFTYSSVRVLLKDKRIKELDYAELINALTPLGLLIWWLDDGSLTVHRKKNKVSIARFGQLATQAFTQHENTIISIMLRDKFGLDTTVHTEKGGIYSDRRYYKLYFSATSMRRLIDIVRPHIHEVTPKCMLYKFNMKYVKTRTHVSTIYCERYNF